MGGEFNFKNFKGRFNTIKITNTHLFGEVPADKLPREITTENVNLEGNYFYGLLPCDTNCDSFGTRLNKNCFIYGGKKPELQKCFGINCCFHFQ